MACPIYVSEVSTTKPLPSYGSKVERNSRILDTFFVPLHLGRYFRNSLP